MATRKSTKTTKQYSESVIWYARQYGYTFEKAQQLLDGYSAYKRSQDVIDELPATAEGW